MPVPAPTAAETWIIDPCNRISFVSLIDTMQRFLFGVKEHLKANGYTVKGSSSGGVAGMDAVDRWTSSAAVTPRATVDAASQAWIVLTDSAGVDILFTYQGASDDIAQISCSMAGDYAAAGTATNKPTSSNEQDLIATTSLILATASGDRLWTCWVNDDADMFRVAIARSGAWVGAVWGCEKVNLRELGDNVVCSPAQGSVGFAYIITQLTAANVVAAFTANQKVGVARVTISSTPILVNLGGGVERFIGADNSYGTEKPELQGATGYPMIPFSWASGTTNARGPFADRIDWWIGRTDATDGETMNGLDFVMLSDVAWPWDGSAVSMT